MKTSYSRLLIIPAFIMTFFSQFISASELTIDDDAPDFSLIDQYQKTHQLSDYQDKWLVLYFYPKDDTPGCTTEACNFRDDIIEIKALGAEVLGVSIDNAESHAKFAEKHGLPFSLLSDPDGAVAKSYGSLMSLGPLKLAKRHSFIIDPEGKLARIYRKVKPSSHSDEIIADLKKLTSE